MSQDKNYITPQGHEKLVKEYDYLRSTERPTVVQAVSDAAAMGDRSENAEYQYGKRRLREIDRRLKFLSDKISAAIIVDPEKQKGDTVLFGACVKVQNEEDEENVYFIVGQDEIDAKEGKISWASPIGKALLGKKVGAKVVIHSPKGEIELEILSIQYKKIQ